MKDNFLGVDMTFVQTKDEVDQFCDWIRLPHEVMGVDAEFQGLIYKKHRVRMVQFGSYMEGFAIPFEGPNSYCGLVQYAFDHSPSKFVFHGITMDTSRLENEGIVLPDWGRLRDTHVSSFLHNNQERSRKLKDLATRYVGVDSRQGELDKNKLFRTRGYDWETVPIDNPIYWKYSILDTVLTSRLDKVLYPHLKPYLRAYDLEMANAKVLKQMMMNGVSVDIDYCVSEEGKLYDERNALMYVDVDGDWRLRDGDVRPNFKEDIMDYFEKQNVAVPVKTSRKSGAYTIDNDVLERIQHPYAAQILRAKKIKHLLDNYFSKVIENEYEGKVHPSLNPVGSDESGLSGRVSMRDPNLIMLETNSYARDIVKAAPGHKLISIDYNNMELRIFASLANCKGLIEDFAHGEDIYKNAAAALYHITPDQVSEVQKGRAKRGIFTWSHGGRAKTFAAYLIEGDYSGDTSAAYEEAIRYYDILRNKYPEIEERQREAERGLKATKYDNYGHVILGDGRRLFVPANRPHQAISFLGMGEAVIILKEALVQLAQEGLGKYLRLPFHDEIISEVPDEYVQEYIDQALPIITRWDYTVPLTCEVNVYDKLGDHYREKE